MDSDLSSTPPQTGKYDAKSTACQEYAVVKIDGESFPQMFQLHGKTSEGVDFHQGGTVIRLQPKSDAIVWNVDPDGVLYRAGIRDGDYLVKVNGVEVQSIGLSNIVSAIGKLDAFKYVLRRDSLGNRKYIQVGFNCGSSAESETQDVDIKLMAADYGVGRDQLGLYFPISIDRLDEYVRINQQTVTARIDLSADDFRFLNTDPTDASVVFSQQWVFITWVVYLNHSDPTETAIVLCPTTQKCIRANSANEVFVGAKGNLKKTYAELDERFFKYRPTNSSLVRLESYCNPGHYLTVNVADGYGAFMAPTNAGPQQFKFTVQ